MMAMMIQQQEPPPKNPLLLHILEASYEIVDRQASVSFHSMRFPQMGAAGYAKRLPETTAAAAEASAEVKTPRETRACRKVVPLPETVASSA